MGKAGKALRQVLETYGISQNRLAVTMSINRSTVSQWFNDGSTNWHDDYALKLEDYGEMGIPEYWIVDYLGLGGRKFIGYPKQPTLSVCQFVEGEYQVRLFRERDRIESLIFPELELTVEQVFQARL